MFPTNLDHLQVYLQNLADSDLLCVSKDVKPIFTVFFQALVDNPKFKTQRDQVDVKILIYQIMNVLMNCKLIEVFLVISFVCLKVQLLKLWKTSFMTNL